MWICDAVHEYSMPPNPALIAIFKGGGFKRAFSFKYLFIGVLQGFQCFQTKAACSKGDFHFINSRLRSTKKW
jgi:hypothetical protein